MWLDFTGPRKGLRLYSYSVTDWGCSGWEEARLEINLGRWEINDDCLAGEYSLPTIKYQVTSLLYPVLYQSVSSSKHAVYWVWGKPLAQYWWWRAVALRWPSKIESSQHWVPTLLIWLLAGQAAHNVLYSNMKGGWEVSEASLGN